MLAIGSILSGRYRIDKLLGQGGMGAVYQALDNRLNKTMALKEMILDRTLDPATLQQMQQQFRQEAIVLAQLNHPNLVRVNDYLDVNGIAYLVMDYVTGETLFQRIRRSGKCGEREALTWANQLLAALSYCHQFGIIHRDIKPQNIMIRPDGQAILVDFGLAKVWNANAPTRTVIRGMGTPEYASPEQYGNRPGATDPRSDIYSLGATFYHVLSGQAPPTVTERISVPSGFQALRQLNPLVSPAVEAAIQKAMALQSSARYQTAEEMQAALIMPFAQANGRIPQPAINSPTRSAKATTFVMVGSGLLFLFVLGGGLLGWLVLRPANMPVIVPTVHVTISTSLVEATQSASATAIVRVPTTRAVVSSTDVVATPFPTTQSKPPTAQSIIAATVVVKPLGKIAYAVGTDLNRQIFITDLGTSNIYAFPKQPANTSVPIWSADGARLIFSAKLDNYWQLFMANADGTGMVQITTGSYHNKNGMLSPDGSRIVFVSERDSNPEIYIMGVNGSNAQRLTNNPAWEDDPVWSPDGQWIAFESKREGRTDIYRMRVNGSNIQRLTSGGESNTTPAYSPDGRNIAFEHKENGHLQIYVMNAEGGAERRITFEGIDNQRPTWSPDSKQIACTSARTEQNIIQDAIWIFDVDGNAPSRRISAYGSIDAWWAAR